MATAAYAVLDTDTGVVRFATAGHLPPIVIGGPAPRDLREALTEATPNEALGIVLDLTEVEYLDSTGIHPIYRMRESLRVRGQGLVIVIPRDSIVNDALRLAGIERGAEIVETLEAGLRALHPGETTDPLHQRVERMPRPHRILMNRPTCAARGAGSASGSTPPA